MGFKLRLKKLSRKIINQINCLWILLRRFEGVGTSRAITLMSNAKGVR